jgi:hypothetical protein
MPGRPGLGIEIDRAVLDCFLACGECGGERNTLLFRL